MIILVVEDDPMMAELWRRFLESASSDIRFAVNIPDALTAMRRLPPPDLVLLDLRVPGSKPTNTLEHIAEFKETNPNAVVIVITGLGTDELRALAARLGADGFHEKASMTTQNALLGAIRESIEKKKYVPGQPAYQRSMDILHSLNSMVAGFPSVVSVEQSPNPATGSE